MPWHEPEITDRIIGEIEEFLTGSRSSESEIDRVLATVMFTDIVDSTRRAAELGDRQWRALLDRHDEVVRQQLQRFRGQEVKHLGDGFMATFDGPARAVRCATAIMDSMQPLGIAVRLRIACRAAEKARSPASPSAARTRRVATPLPSRGLRSDHAGSSKPLRKDLLVGGGEIGRHNRIMRRRWSCGESRAAHKIDGRGAGARCCVMAASSRLMITEAERRFPVRIVVAVPPGGFGQRLNGMQSWLDETCGADGWSMTPAGLRGVVNDAVAIYFADATIAAAFVARWCRHAGPDVDRGAFLIREDELPAPRISPRHKTP